MLLLGCTVFGLLVSRRYRRGNYPVPMPARYQRIDKTLELCRDQENKVKKANKQLRQILQSDRTQIRPFTALSVPLCFFVSTIAAYASGTNGLPTVVMHPVHTFTTPVHFSTPSAGNSNPGSNNGSQAGNTGGSQSGSTGTQAGSNSGGGIHSHTQSSNL